MKRDYLIRFAIAGFSYYEGALAFRKLKIGKRLKLVAEPQNVYDKHAVAIYYKKYKLGFIPKDKNRFIALFLNNDINYFEARVQCIHVDEHPEAQIEVIIYVVEKEV